MITRETKIVFYNIEKEVYETRPLKAWTNNRVPVCTSAHFMNTVMKFFEDCTPKIQDNPMYQKIDWSTARENKMPEVSA